jgi:excinuclease ABC subunit C
VTALLKHRPAEFQGFGPSILAKPSRGKITRSRIPLDRMAARSMLHDDCPLSPGVYGWLDANSQICYVGKSKSLRKRLLSYFAKTPADKKAERIRQHSQQLVWEPISDELLALIREQELIHRWRPDFNSQGQPTRRQPAFVCVGGGSAPNAFLARTLSPRASFAFGPIAGTGQLRSAIASLNQVFHLRDCPDKTGFNFNDQRQLFADASSAKCIRYELGSCPGPCAGLCKQAAYRTGVDAAVQFLEGLDRSILLELNRKMEEASARCSFERASVLRDHLANLSWLDRRLSALRFAQMTFNGVLPIRGRRNRMIWMVLRAGRLLGSAPRPDRPERAIKAIKSLTQTATRNDQLPTTVLEMNLQLIMISWFKKNPQQKQELISFESAIDFCQQRISGRQKVA